jgi:hypothetical protein
MKRCFFFYVEKLGLTLAGPIMQLQTFAVSFRFARMLSSSKDESDFRKID